ncbi:tetratricopeptide repeat protein [candidate division WOR-3 bacterium]|nr:tetratricopeptide repeat protein [candidate division WOR-3 bacterium]
MKCPFLIERKDVFDDDGRKVGEEIELQECIRNECMIFDGATKLCSLLSSNMKTGVLIDDVKNGMKDLKEEMFQRTESLGVVVSTTVQTLQEALLGRFDILKKQNEVMVLGFDRLMETISNKFEAIKTVFSGFNDNLNTLKDSINNQGEGIKSVAQSLKGEVNEIKNANMRFSEDIIKFNEELFNKLAEYNERNGKANENTCSKLDILRENLEKLAATNQVGMETISGEIEKIVSVDKEVLAKLNQLDTSTLANDFRNVGDSIKEEVINLKNDQAASLNNVQGALTNLESLFKQSSDSLTTMNDTMRDLNSNYIESLGKIAGLAEGMRKGVEKVGEGMHDSVNDLIEEMKKETGALEKQYEETFADIANLADKFDGLNTRIKDMTNEVEREFKESFDRQTIVSDYTKTIVEHIKEYFDKEDARYKEEQKLGKKKEGLDHFDRATLYYYRGNYEIAVNEINKALEIEQTTEYLNLKGLLLVQLRQFDESKKVYKEALKLEPNLAEIHNNLGLLYLKMKKLDDAVVSFQEAVKKNVNYAPAYVNLGNALIELEKFDDAIKAYQYALEIDPSNREANEAIKLYKEGKIGE